MSARHHRTSPHRGNRRGAKGGMLADGPTDFVRKSMNIV